MCSEVINFIIAIRTLEKIRLKKIGLQYRPVINLVDPNLAVSTLYPILFVRFGTQRTNCFFNRSTRRSFTTSYSSSSFGSIRNQFGVSRSSLSLGLYRSCNVS
ncbi:unnamed protein product [Acanthoscelides obtectus]|uniref:Uncharacterized protein n=2 Tax=Acanthoscelides obtectus TaxID=200917 RepID=A0A9P0K5F6_ACAOB|nr:unnamed protein product [Acanthoscelides obtectus]CAK1654046.1 hypothetical protein AOBTE_LOCUS18436 [Acanthoscelides obtectus]